MFDIAPSPRFRIDAWASDYVGSLDLDDNGFDPEADPFEIDTQVEHLDWSTPVVPVLVERPERIVFVDGVQRVEVWGRIEGAEGPVEAALASVAVGAAVSYEGRAEILFETPLRVRRVLAVAGASSLPSMAIKAGSQTLEFEPETSAMSGRDGVHDALGKYRAAAEDAFARLQLDERSLLVVDGRLHIDPGSYLNRVVGMAKTMQRVYLPPEENRLLAHLGAGERTPIFRIHYHGNTRYSWYLRLPYTRAIHHSLAGIIRLETPEIGVENAVRLANLTAFHLPAFASRPEHDPRAPQNLLPIGALEKRLRHEMGDALWLRRTIEDYLYESEMPHER